MKSKFFEFHIKLSPQKKIHTRNVHLVVNVEAKNAIEARALVIEKLYNEGYLMTKFRVEKMIRDDEE